jgi:hypothetical protein
MNKGVCVEEVFTDFFFLHASRVTMTILRLKTMSCHQRTSSVYYLSLAFSLPNTWHAMIYYTKEITDVNEFIWKTESDL